MVFEPDGCVEIVTSIETARVVEIKGSAHCSGVGCSLGAVIYASGNPDNDRRRVEGSVFLSKHWPCPGFSLLVPRFCRGRGTVRSGAALFALLRGRDAR